MHSSGLSDNQILTTLGMTRSISDMTAGANKNRNLWAATDGDFNLLVPTPLTAGQRLRVRAYFQAHPNLTWEAPTMTNYFIQQVYKGANATAGQYSAEQYPQGNGSIVVGSNHMDQLTVGSNNVHVLDFNYGDNPNTAKDVKDNGTLTNDTKYHSDQITLMIGVQPTCVGFQSSDGSVKHNDCMALAGAKVIDDWAIANEAALKAAGLFGEDVWYGTDQYGYENKSWNRSFVGLDYEQLTLAQCSTNRNVKISDFQKDWVWDGTRLWRKSEYISTNGDDLLYNNNVVKYITSNTNEICGTNVDENQQTWYLTRMDASQMGGNSSEEVIDLTKVKAKLDTNCYPVENGGLQKWVKNIGGRDYVYSDWIVTLTPAKENTPIPDTPQVYIINTDTQKQKVEVFKSKQISQAGRVMCEDLANYANLDDFDYNDIVFDVIIVRETTKTVTTPLNGNDQPSGDPVTTTDDNYYANIRLMAAGGTIPAEIKIGRYGYFVVHDVLGGKPTDTMINTLSEGERSKVNGAAVDSIAPVDLTHDNGDKDFYGISDIADIEVYVKYGNDATRLIPKKGQPSPIFVVPLNTLWPKERAHIADAYKTFKKWVGDEATGFWLGKKDNSMLYQKYQSEGFQNGKDYWILPETLEQGYPKITVVSSSTTSQLVNATNNKMVVPGNGETKLVDYDPEHPGYLCPATSTQGILSVRVPGYADAKVGNIVRIYGVSASGWWIRTDLSTNDISTYTAEGYIDIPVTMTNRSSVRTGFTISGEKFTVTYVTLRTSNQ